jgi:hypothetical protein
MGNENENDEFDDMSVDPGEDDINEINKNLSDSDFKKERRNSKRFDEKLSAKIENKTCVVLNVSNQGVLLQTAVPIIYSPLSTTIDFELQVEGEWIHIRGKVMWVQTDVLHSKIGLFIQYAPEPYFNFLRTLYE